MLELNCREHFEINVNCLIKTCTYNNTSTYPIFKTIRFLFPLPIAETQVETVLQPEEIGIVIEEVVDVARQINLAGDSDGVQELLDAHNQELIEMHEQDIEELESLDLVHNQKIKRLLGI
ncbi:hypothetical protein TNCV_2403871 [Trichonephila clavipes]|nr:hypothetical protein TNCV_2403871 [Trichonephila clavipes]